ncbi:MAG: NADPH-dependent FMN reductase, partial [Rhodanobacter sp.]
LHSDPLSTLSALPREHTMTTHILSICGSLRTGSYNAALMRALPELAPTDMKLTEAPSYSALPMYNADLQDRSGFPAAAVALADAIRTADGVIIITPEYNWSIPGALKNAIDWLSKIDQQPFAEKPVAIQSASAGPLGGSRMQYHLRMILTSLKAQVFGTPEIFVGLAHTKFDEESLDLVDAGTRHIVGLQLAAFEKFVVRTKG